MIPHEIAAAFDINGALIFRYECGCGLRSGWADSPEQTEADRPLNCRRHDEYRQEVEP